MEAQFADPPFTLDWLQAAPHVSLPRVASLLRAISAFFTPVSVIVKWIVFVLSKNKVFSKPIQNLSLFPYNMLCKTDTTDTKHYLYTCISSYHTNTVTKAQFAANLGNHGRNKIQSDGLT